jgi:uncharacterized protein (DUF305 family)
MDGSMQHKPYLRLLGMTALSFVSMYILMYAMVDVFGNVYPNVNQVYMAGLMTAPMVVIEVLLMGSMYHHKQMNLVIISAALGLGLICAFYIRTQFMVGDQAFLRSMIPHHASALLMCNEAELTDPELIELCQNILEGQQAEIDFMKAKLSE